ncbi:MAG: NifU family protein [Ureaplasma sp.]|nr:NifU family protein [Ureaplasma sp.]
MDINKRIEDIKEVIETIRLYIQQDGGDLEFVEYRDNVVTIKLLGACVGCSMTDFTYKDGVESILKDEIDPNIEILLVE